jgi:hypothetical protein
MISSHSTLAGGRRQQRLTYYRHRWFDSCRAQPRAVRVCAWRQPRRCRKSIPRLLTAAGREKLLISDADLCKSPDCLRSTYLFDLNSQLRICACAAAVYFFSRRIQSAVSSQVFRSAGSMHGKSGLAGRPGWLPIANEVAANRQRGTVGAIVIRRSPASSAPIASELTANRQRGLAGAIVICRSPTRSAPIASEVTADRQRGTVGAIVISPHAGMRHCRGVRYARR